MSYYFRPPNSREQNLFIIRFSIDDLSNNNFTGNTLQNSAYTSPAKVFLPANLSLVFNESDLTFTIDYTNAKFEIPPTVNIQMREILTTNIPPIIGYYVSIINITNTSVTYGIYSNSIDNNTIVPVITDLLDGNPLNNVGIQVQIIGRTTTGPTFAIANQGWTYVESTDPTADTIYSTMNVGTKGVIPPFGLTIGGTYGYLGGAGNGGVGNTTKLENYTPDEAISNINNYSFFPIILTANETKTLPVVTSSNIGQEITLLINVNVSNYILTILDTNTTLSQSINLQSVGDSVKFVVLSTDNSIVRWVKINNI